MPSSKAMWLVECRPLSTNHFCHCHQPKMSIIPILPLALLASRIEAGASDGAAAPEVTKVSTTLR